MPAGFKSNPQLEMEFSVSYDATDWICKSTLVDWGDVDTVMRETESVFKWLARYRALKQARHYVVFGGYPPDKRVEKRPLW